MPSPIGTARDIEFDIGQNVDIVQILGAGGGVLQANTLGGLVYGTAVSINGVVAHAGGGQANATTLLGPSGAPVSMARIVTVANAGDSVILPPSQVGYQIVILNDDASHACNVFPALGEMINSQGTNNALSVAVGTPTIFYCFSAGLWRTK